MMCLEAEATAATGEAVPEMGSEPYGRFLSLRPSGVLRIRTSLPKAIGHHAMRCGRQAGT